MCLLWSVLCVFVLYEHVNDSLTRPFRVSRGIHQGCGLSGILYVIAIEPFLVSLRNKLVGLSVVCLSTSDLITVRLSAYADDVTIIIRCAQDVANQNEYMKVMSCAMYFVVLCSPVFYWFPVDCFPGVSCYHCLPSVFKPYCFLCLLLVFVSRYVLPCVQSVELFM